MNSAKTKVSDLKKEIEKLNEQKNQVQKSKLKNILSNKQILIEIQSDKKDPELKKKNDLINILLRNGYIDENYSDCISIFHEGALTKSDYQFLINVKKEEKTELNYKLIKTNELIKKIDDFAFEKEYIFNHNLVDFLLKTQTYKIKKDLFLKQISNEEISCINFIDEHIDNSTNIELFIYEICHYWQNIWNFIYHKTQFTDERIDKYFRLIINYANIDDIENIFEKNIEYLNKYADFLNISTKKGKLQQVIERLELKFVSIEIDSPEGYLEYIFTNNNYDINIVMFRILMSFNKDFEWEVFEKANYGYILSKQYQYQIDYIHTNIDEYVEFVYLKLENNNEEEIEDYIQLLNNSDLDISLKEKVIIQVKTIVGDVSDIEDSIVINLLFKYSKVNPTWDNILYIFELEEDKLNEHIIAYLNSLSNYEVLSKKKMTIVKDGDKSRYSAICKAIIHEQKINVDSYKQLTKSIPWWYESFDAEKLSKDKVVILIENSDVNPTITSYKYLKENFNGTNILLLERYFDKFESSINEIEFDTHDLYLILISYNISTKYKFEILENCTEKTILANPENIKRIAQLIINHESYSTSDSLKILLIKNSNVSHDDRLKLFDRYNTLIKRDILEDFLISMSGNYAEITNTSKKATIENNPLNRKLLEVLVRLDYISSYSENKKGLRVNHKRKE